MALTERKTYCLRPEIAIPRTACDEKQSREMNVEWGNPQTPFSQFRVARSIIEIDGEKCNGCGLCVTACHEGAIQMVDGKAKLVSDIYCDGLGDCLGPCPTGAISMVTRTAEAYDEQAVADRMAGRRPSHAHAGCPGSASTSLKGTPASDFDEPTTLACGCPGAMSQSPKPAGSESTEACGCGCGCDGHGDSEESAQYRDQESELMNWPVQLKLVPPAAPYLKGANILLAADCTAVAAPNFHQRYLKNKPVVIACPKLEETGPQVAKLAEIIKAAQPASLTVLRMEVPCCGGLVRVAQDAVAHAGITTPINTIILGSDGKEK